MKIPQSFLFSGTLNILCLYSSFKRNSFNIFRFLKWKSFYERAAFGYWKSFDFC